MGASIWTPGTQVTEVVDPTVSINILPGSASTPGLDFQGDTNTGIYQSSAGHINLAINGVQAIDIDTVGDLTTTLGKWVSNEEVDVATAATVNLGAATSNIVRLTGTSNVSSFGTTYRGPIFCRAAGAFILSNTTSLILPNTASINVSAGDSWIAVPKATSGTPDGWVVVGYVKASGTSINANSDLSNTLRTDVASASTVDLTISSLELIRNLNITGTTTINGFTVATAGLYFVRFAAALTLTNSASLVTQTGANILTTAGDTCILRATAVNTVEVLSYNSVLATAANVSKTIRVNSAGTKLEAYTPTNPGLVLLNPGGTAPTAAATLDFLNSFSSTYDNYRIIGQGLKPNANENLCVRLAVAGVTDAGANYSAGMTNTATTTQTNQATITTGTTSAGSGADFILDIVNANATTGIKMLSIHSVTQNAATPQWVNSDSDTVYFAANAVTGVRFFWAGGNNFTANGLIYIYGYSKI